MWKDARMGQMSFLLLFLVLGLSTRDWTLHPLLLGVVVLSCLGTQWMAMTVLPSLQRPGRGMAEWWCCPGWQSALITALGLCVLLRANHPTTMMVAGCCAIASKFLFRYDQKHFFNPSNFGIIAALLLTPDAWVSPGQWGTEGWYFLLFVGTGGLILKQVGRWDTSATFFLTYAGLTGMRNLWLGWSWDVWTHQLMSGSLLLFALFMITDPRSIPNARMSRVLWSIGLAWLTFILQYYGFVSTAPFWALFCFAPLTPILDTLWSAPRFQWLKMPSSLVSSPF